MDSSKTMKDLILKGSFDEAIVYGFSRQANDPDQAAILHYIGDSFYKKSEFNLAVSFYRKSLAIDEDRIWTIHNLAKCLEMLGDPESLRYHDRAASMSNAIVFHLERARSRFQPLEKKKDFLTKLYERDPRVLFEDWKIENNYPLRMKGDLEVIMRKERGGRWFNRNSENYNEGFSKFASLSNKKIGSLTAEKLGLRTPRVYANGKLSDILPGLKSERFALKPEHGISSQGVLLMDCGFDLLNRTYIGENNKIKDAYTKRKLDWENKNFIAEELISDYDRKNNPYTLIPRDFKCFAVHGKLLWINVYNRNSERNSLMTMASYSKDWSRLPKTASSYHDSSPIERPELLPELIAATEMLSRKFPYFMRFDFYIDQHGPVFGEFTHTSSGGRYQSDFGERTQLQTLFIHPDPHHPTHDDNSIATIDM